MTLVPSLKVPNQVQTSGFELADSAGHMLAWLGKGDDCRRFVVNDIEDGLYQQAPGGQVLDVSCNDKPEITTATQANDNAETTPLTGFRVKRPICWSSRDRCSARAQASGHWPCYRWRTFPGMLRRTISPMV